MPPLRSLVAGAACCALLPSYVHAAATPASNTDDTATIQDIMIISASREPVPDEHVIGSLTVLDAETLATSHQPFVSALLRTVPGLALSRSGGAGQQTQLRTRGTEANQTLVMIDGIEANDLSVGSGFDFAHLTGVGLERVEVLRGPQSALWGSDALGGVVSMRTPRGEGAPAGALAVEGGAFDTRSVRANLQAGSELADGFLAIGRRRLDGTNVSRTGDEDDGYENTTAATRLGWRPADGIAVDVTGRYVDATTEFDPVGPSSRPVDGDQETDSEQLLLGARLGWRSAQDHLRSHLALDLTDTDNVTRVAGAETNQTAGRRLQFTWQGSLAFETRLGARAEHRITLAAERERNAFHQRAAATMFGDPNQDQELTHDSGVLEYRGRLRALTLSASLRHDANEAFDDATTWRTGVLWRVAEYGTQLHARVGEAVKNPTFTERFGFSPDTFFGNPGLEPEHSLGWEAGIEQSLADDRASFGATWFASELDDEINGFVFDPGVGAFTARNVDGESERRGVELNARALPGRRTELIAAATWLDASEPSGSGAIEEIRRAEWSASLRGRIAFAGGRGDAWLGASWEGEREDADFATFPATRLRLDDYLHVNAAVSYRVHPNVELWVRGENLTDADYESVLGYATPGAAAYAGIRLDLAASR